MKLNYYVNNIARYNGDHEVHLEACPRFPKAERRIYLGDFVSCQEALLVARETYRTANGCIHCCYGCHKA